MRGVYHHLLGNIINVSRLLVTGTLPNRVGLHSAQPAQPFLLLFLIIIRNLLWLRLTTEHFPAGQPSTELLQVCTPLRICTPAPEPWDLPPNPPLLPSPGSYTQEPGFSDPGRNEFWSSQQSHGDRANQR